MTALARLGAIQNPLIPILREREVGFITNQVGTEVFITTERWRGFEHGELARSLAADQGFTVVLTDLDTDPTTIGNTLRLPEGDATTLPAAPSLDDAPMRWIYTSSGTTADPKGVRHTDRSVMHGATGPIGTGASPDDVNAVAVPVSHIGGMLMLTAGADDRHAARAVRVVRSRDVTRALRRARRDGARQRGALLPRVLRRPAAPRRRPAVPSAAHADRRRRAHATGDQPPRARGARRARDRQLVGPHRVPRRHLRAARRTARGARHHDRSCGRRASRCAR